MFLDCGRRSECLEKTLDFEPRCPYCELTSASPCSSQTCLSFSSPENFLGPQTLEVSAHAVQALKCSLHTQRTEYVFGAYPVEVKGHSGYVSSSARFVLVFEHH